MGRKENIDKDSKTLSLKPDQRILLLRSVAQYLDRNGFSKSLKKFLFEAEIEKKDFGSSSLDLEEIFFEYLEKSHHAAKNLSKEENEDKEIHGQSVKEAHNESVAAEETTGKKKKKKQQQQQNIDESDEKTSVSAEVSKENTDKSIPDDLEKKQKDKKKTKESNSEKTEEKPEVTDSDMEDKPKDTKKKKNKSKSNKSIEEVNGLIDKESDKSRSRKRKSGETESIEVEKTSEEDEANKVSKKRKMLEAEENIEQTVDKKGAKESNSIERDDKVDNKGALKTPEKKLDGQENGNLEISGANSTQKSGNKQHTGSKEPKKPFQRVNVEEVVFTDEKLQDNSYWAKDGAEEGYGAKAQEILGQVRGRDFRHEKTKKKRGTYRGGNIDLQSHSVKFNYSDEE